MTRPRESGRPGIGPSRELARPRTWAGRRRRWIEGLLGLFAVESVASQDASSIKIKRCHGPPGNFSWATAAPGRATGVSTQPLADDSNANFIYHGIFQRHHRPDLIWIPTASGSLGAALDCTGVTSSTPDLYVHVPVGHDVRGKGRVLQLCSKIEFF